MAKKMTKATKAKVKRWADKISEANKLENELLYDTIGIQQMSTFAGIHMDNVIPLAEALDCRIIKSNRYDVSGEYPIRLDIIYNGTVFFSIHKEAEVEGVV